MFCSLFLFGTHPQRGVGKSATTLLDQVDQQRSSIRPPVRRISYYTPALQLSLPPPTAFPTRLTGAHSHLRTSHRAVFAHACRLVFGSGPRQGIFCPVVDHTSSPAAPTPTRAMRATPAPAVAPRAPRRAPPTVPRAPRRFRRRGMGLEVSDGVETKWKPSDPRALKNTGGE